jgi:purine nucleosidase
MTHKIILDTDIGTDVDDILALTLALNSPELELLAVTTAYGDTRLRAKLTHQVLSMAGAAQIPVAAGATTSLTGERPVWWPGHEGRNSNAHKVPDTVIGDQSAVECLLETVRAHPGEVTIVALAPLVNLAQAIERDPQIMRRVRKIVMMGGVFGFHDPLRRLPVAEHNIVCDPEAARVVFDFGLPVDLFPLDVTLSTVLLASDIQTLGEVDHPLSQLLYREVKDWLEFFRTELGRDHTQLHDPLTVASLIDPQMITQSFQAGLKIECRGEYTTGMTVTDHDRSHVRIVQAIDLPRFYELFSQRVVQFYRQNVETRVG